MPLRILTMPSLLLVLASLAGCYEDTDVELHEPGVYQGKRDELLDAQASPDHQAALRARLTIIQSDR